jgi:biopolymer transport protein ExbB
VIPFADPLDAEAATAAVSTGEGAFPFDPTLGNAHKIEATEETLREHVEKGGPVMIPIFAMAGLALLVALFKWFGLAFKRKPSRKKIAALLGAVAENDPEAARAAVARIKGPVGKMLSAGVEHLNEPRELIEEVMYEQMLTAKLKLQRMLPFIAVCAASAPLLGLLGTVTGIINTFKLITVFGSGDVKTLSGGISEALITTEFGLIVAIPSLLLHAFLSRKARAIVGHMETSAASFLNEVGRAQGGQHALRTHGAPAGGGAAPDPDMVRQQVSAILGDLLGPLMEEQRSGNADASAGTSSGNARARVPASQPG